MAAKTSNRMVGIDALRGIAIILMVIFHFFWTFDALYYMFHQRAHETINNLIISSGWRRFGLSILGMFLSISGFVSFWSWQKGFVWLRFFRRLWKVAIAAIIISTGSFVMSKTADPSFFIFFGVLHHITLGLVLLALMRKFPTWLLAVLLGFCFFAPRLLANPVCDMPMLWWLGLWTEAAQIRSVDLVPLFPWFWMMLTGAVLARLIPNEKIVKLANHPSIQNSLTYKLAWLGRYSLLIYLIHPPILFGLVAFWFYLL